MKRPLTILKYPWHVGHDYELSKIPAEFDLLMNTSRRWNSRYRPFPSNFQPVDSIGDSAADIAIVHVDQWTWQELDKRRLFLRVLNEAQMPKVVINHGCNLVDGCSSTIMSKFIGQLPMICNSSTAKRFWNVRNSRYIHHGQSVEEWEQSNYGNLNVVITQPYSGPHQAYRNNAAALKLEKDLDLKLAWIGRDLNFKSFDQYRTYLASSSIYFNPSFASPNPRARTEAMLSGVVVVTTDNHGESNYIVNGENGFASNNMAELFDFISYLLSTPREVRRIGRAGRATAQRIFGIDRFVEEWLEVIDDVISGRPVARENEYKNFW